MRAAESQRPNFLIIVADDLGFSDLGAFGGEIETPSLDALATSGLRMTQFHATPSCSPSRAELMSGVDNHIAGLGTMAELRSDALKNAPGYEGWLNQRVTTIAEVLREAGYRTLMSGKWHLGLTKQQSPAARGFEKSFALLQGDHNHFGLDQDGGEFMRSTYREDGELTRYPPGQYSSDVFTDKLIGYLEATRQQQKPFLAYLAYTAPHWPLQAPPELIAKYHGRYDTGPEALREQRLRKMRSLGQIETDTVPHPLDGVIPWSQLSPAQRTVESRKMEIYAAMVDRLDFNVGKLVRYLKETQQFDNTVIIFMSDNGPEGSQLDGGADANAVNGFGAVLKQWIADHFNNELDHLGQGDSFVWYGPGWAQAGSAPARLYKGFPTEGGIRVPAFILGPGVIRKGISAVFANIADIFPTLLDLAAIHHLERFDGRPVATQRDHSWVNFLSGRTQTIYSSTEPIGWELFFRRAIRVGDWKAVYLPEDAFSPSVRPARWELFNLSSDPGEVHDLSAREPVRLATLIEEWSLYARDVGVQIPEVLR